MKKNSFKYYKAPYIVLWETPNDGFRKEFSYIYYIKTENKFVSNAALIMKENIIYSANNKRRGGNFRGISDYVIVQSRTRKQSARHHVVYAFISAGVRERVERGRQNHNLGQFVIQIDAIRDKLPTYLLSFRAECVSFHVPYRNIPPPGARAWTTLSAISRDPVGLISQFRARNFWRIVTELQTPAYRLLDVPLDRWLTNLRGTEAGKIVCVTSEWNRFPMKYG